MFRRRGPGSSWDKSSQHRRAPDARELDEQYSRPQVRIQGPDGTWQSVPDASQPAGDGIRRLLGSFTRVRGLVFGQYGEWSLDVSHLISISAARALPALVQSASHIALASDVDF